MHSFMTMNRRSRCLSACQYRLSTGKHETDDTINQKKKRRRKTANDLTEPYTMNDKAYAAPVNQNSMWRATLKRGGRFGISDPKDL